jgi:hypothetical protein
MRTWTDMIDSMKTYGVAMLGWIVSVMNWTCHIVEKLTVILIFVSVIVRLIYDIPRAMESIRRYRQRKGEPYEP